MLYLVFLIVASIVIIVLIAFLEKASRKIKELETTLISTKIPGFFPTPKTVTERLVDEAGINLSNQHIANGFSDAVWAGRFQILSLKPVIVVDASHNRDSALKLRIALDDYFPGQDVTLIFGASEDKDISGMFTELMPRVSKIIVTQADHPRATPIDRLAKQARAYGLSVELITPVSAALEQAIRTVDQEAIVLATGSLFVAGEVLTAWESIQQKFEAD